MDSTNSEMNRDISYEEFCETYDDHVQWRDWTSLDYLCEEYPHYVKMLRSEQFGDIS